jgi:acetylglutamate kinase
MLARRSSFPELISVLTWKIDGVGKLVIVFGGGPLITDMHVSVPKYLTLGLQSVMV